MKKYIELGTFEVETGQIIAIDPSYPFDERQVMKNVFKGTWNSRAEVVLTKKGDIISKLIITPSILNEQLFNSLIKKWRRVKGIFGVDSAQFGFFDLNYFADNEFYREFNKDADNPFYELCLAATNNKPFARVIPFGVVSVSGYGDGAYVLSALYNSRKEIIGLLANYGVEEEL